MARREGRSVAAETSQQQQEQETRGFFEQIGWVFFLTMVAVVPLLVGAMPRLLGALAIWRAADPLVLPKVVAMVALSGISLASFAVATMRREVEVRWHPAMWVVLGLCAWTAVSAAVSSAPWRGVLGGYNSNDGLIAMLDYAIVAFLAIQYIRRPRHLRTLSIVAVISGALVSLYGLLQFWGIDPFYAETPVRIFSTFGNPDMLADYLVFPFVLSVGLALTAKTTRARVACWASAGLLSAVLIASGTRGGWLGALCALGCLFFAVWNPQWVESPRRVIRIAVVSLAVLLVGATWVWYANPLAGRKISLANGLLGATSGRTIIWATGLRAWLTRPVFGWGPDAFGRAFDSAVRADWFSVVEGLQKADTAHSIVIQLVTTIGLPGLLLFVSALVWALWASRSALGHARSGGDMLRAAVWAAVVGQVVALLFGVTQPPVTVWLWLSVGMLLAAEASPAGERSHMTVASIGAVTGVALAVWSVSWLVADVYAGWAQQQPIGETQLAAYERAAAINPVLMDYRWLVAESAGELGNAYRKAGRRDLAAPFAARAVREYGRAMTMDPGDAMLKVAAAGDLQYYGRTYADMAALQEGVRVAEAAAALAPQNPAALVVLAQAYQSVGRTQDAERIGRLARSISPAYAAENLGDIGGSTTP